ncbi:MAG: type I-U CRISPR-associated protein Csb2 [Deltaproteobacteria bacterium]|jgi:CRISPR-associated protein Csb2
MLRLEFRFLAGRYHATPWDHHVNEGSVEWPPSPARILRALLAASYVEAETPDEPPSDAVALLERLASVLPTYFVPPARTAHLRHYMPAGNTTTKVLDSFLRFEDATVGRDQRVLGGASSLWVDWPIELDTEERCVLQRLLERVGYLGRAESWCSVAVVDPEVEEAGDRVRVLPDLAAATSSTSMRLLAWSDPTHWATWRTEAVERSLGAEASRKGSALSNAQRTRVASTVPERWIDALSTQSSAVAKHGWSQPPGTRWCVYRADRPLLETTAPRTQRRSRPSDRVNFVILTLASTAKHREVLPRLTRCVRQAELLHSRLAKALHPHGSVPLLGASNHEAIPSDHRHAHLLPVDTIARRPMAGATRAPGAINHILVWSDMGLGHIELSALRRVDRLERRRRDHSAEDSGRRVADEDLFVTVVVEGDRNAVERFGLNGRELRNLVGASDVFESVTPYVPARHLKRSHNVIDDVRRELSQRPSILEQVSEPKDDWLDGVQVEVLSREIGLKKRLRDFERRRERYDRRPPTARFFGLRVVLPTPIKGPVALGFGSHFGLGLFEAVDR